MEGHPYYLHADLVSRHSNPLDRMIHGRMAEAQEGFAILEEVDKGTFERFMDWTYKGYYKAADFETDASISPTPDTSSKEEGETTGWSEVESHYVDCAVNPPTDQSLGKSKRSNKPKKAKTSQELKESFLQREYTVRREVISIPRTRANRLPYENHTEVFLSHARLYVFAEQYDIQPLKVLAYEELHNALAIYTLYPRRTGDIVTLLRYVYANTGVTAKGDTDLRKLLKDYVGYEMSNLMKNQEFQDLMLEDGGPLLRDFMKMVARRIT